MTLAESLRELAGPWVPRVEVTDLTPLTLSLLTAQSCSHSHSSGSGASGSSPHTLAGELSDCPSHSPPHCAIPSSSVSTSVPFVLILQALFLLRAPTAAFASAFVTGPAAATCSAAKKLAVEVVTLALLEPMEHCPCSWRMCEWCSQQKAKCAPPIRAVAPYMSCTFCLKQGSPCLLGLKKPKCIAKAK